MRSVAARVLRSRAAGSLLITCLTSASGLVIAVAVARSSTVADTGRFGIAASVLLLLGAVARSGGVDPLVVLARRPEDIRSLGRASCIALVGAAIIAIAATALALPWLGVVAVAAHGAVLRECVRAAQIARGRVRLVALIELGTTVGAGIAATGALCGAWDAFTAFTVWAVVGSTLGYASAVVHRSDVAPVWKRSPMNAWRSASFMGDTLIGSGTVQASTWIATAVGGLPIAAGTRGAGTLAGPVTVVLTAIRSVLLPRAVAHSAAPDGLRRLVRDTLGMTALAAPFLVLLALFPDRVGESLLGETWSIVHPVMPLVAFELLLQVAAAPAEALHRVSASDRRILAIRATLAAVRVASVALVAPFGLGAVLGAALGTTATGAVVQWCSVAALYRTRGHLPQRTSPEHDRINA